MRSSAVDSLVAKIRPANVFYLSLVGATAGLAVIHLTLADRIGNESLVGNGCLFWGACIYLIWQQRKEQLSFGSGPISSCLGLFGLMILLVRTVALPTEAVLLAFPFLSFLCLGLLASGRKKLSQFRNILLILAFLGLPQLLIGSFIDISPITARASAFILWYTGFDVALQNVYVHLPGGSIEVYRGCSGLSNMMHMLGICIMFGVFLPLDRFRRGLSIFLALSLGFVVNAFRVALMAFLVANSTSENFEYWHLGSGSLIFSMVTVLLFGISYILMIRWQAYQENTGNQRSEPRIEL